MAIVINGQQMIIEANERRALDYVSPTQSSFTPQSTNDDVGAVGQIVYDTSYMYIKTDAGWKRIALQMF